MTTTFLDSALRLAKLSLKVFPVHGINDDGSCTCKEGLECPEKDKGKHPVIANWQKLATTDTTKITNWSKKYPNANVGIATGHASTLTVLDVDGEEGKQSLKQLEEKYGPLPKTTIVKTGSGFFHHYFTHCKEFTNSVKFLPGLDTRNDGGYVVAPKSKHSSGGIYEFLVTPEQAGFAEVPGYLLSAFKEAKEQKKTKSSTAILEEGERNSGLFEAGIGLWHRGRTEEEVLDALEKANQSRCKPPVSEKELRQVHKSITSYEPELPAYDTEGRRNIFLGQDQLREVADMVASALAKRNQQSETLYRNQDTLVQVYQAGSEPLSRLMTNDLMLSELVRHNNWYTSRYKNLAPSDPPEKLIKLLLTDINLAAFRNLRSISPWPMIDKQGQLLAHNGYHPGAERIITVPPSYRLDVPAQPSTDDLRWAIDLLQNDLFVDFPFSDQASRANAMAPLLQLFCCELMQPPYPLHFIQAPVAGTGKSLLVKVIGSILFGKEPSAMTLGENDGETRKRISSQLFSLAPYMFLDNLPPKVHSHSLAAALTASVWNDRILGVSTMKSVDVSALWLATGNNVNFSNELARRLVLVELDPTDESPSTRTGFKHPNLMEWVQQEREALIRACLILVRHWYASGQPKGKQAFGSYESYASVIGGILDAAGIEGFLENRTEEFLNQDDDSFFWNHIVKAWYAAYGESAISVGMLLNGVLDEEFINDYLPSDDRNTSLGMKVSQVKKRVFSGLKIVPLARGHNGRAMYRLQSVTGKHTPPEEVY